MSNAIRRASRTSRNPGRPVPRRFTVLTVLTLVMAVVGGTAMMVEDMSDSGLQIRGADISFTLQEEAIGQVLRVGGEPLPPEVILAGEGATHVRLRVWVDPAAGVSDLASALALAERAHAAGMKLVVDLHYSDTWADRTSQTLPAAWSGLNQEQLKVQVENYTRHTVEAFAAQGTPADIVQIGNEINMGMMWPAGQIYSGNGEKWLEFTDLLRAGINGATAGDPAQKPSIMMHVDLGGDVGGAVYFFDRLREFGVDYDVIGLSYYPFWNEGLTVLEENIHVLSARYAKDVLIAETAYPWTLESSDGGPTVLHHISQLPEADLYPPTPEGQKEFYRALTKVLLGVPNGRGLGFLVWEPGWLPGVPATNELGNTHNNLTLFDWSGNALPALAAFRKDFAEQ